jgi:hypothetical protein
MRRGECIYIYGVVPAYQRMLSRYCRRPWCTLWKICGVSSCERTGKNGRRRTRLSRG